MLAAGLVYLGHRRRAWVACSLRFAAATVSNTRPTTAQLTLWKEGLDPNFIHMNAAGASPTSAASHEALVRHLEREREVGPYAAAAEMAACSQADAKQALAQLINCDADEVALADSAQRAWAYAFTSLALSSHDRVLCFEDEYAGNAVAFLQASKRTGASLEVLPMRADGIVDVDALRAALATPPPPHAIARRTVVALTHLATGGSIIQPAAAVGALAKAHDALFLLDTCQTIGAMPVDVRALHCDFACGTGRKWLRGPRGTGFLYARRDVLLGVGPQASLVPWPCLNPPRADEPRQRGGCCLPTVVDDTPRPAPISGGRAGHDRSHLRHLEWPTGVRARARCLAVRILGEATRRTRGPRCSSRLLRGGGARVHRAPLRRARMPTPRGPGDGRGGGDQRRAQRL